LRDLLDYNKQEIRTDFYLKNQLDAQLILSIFRQPFCCPGWTGTFQPG